MATSLQFFIPDGKTFIDIPKTIVFINKIDDIIELEKYFRSKLLKYMLNRV